MATSKIFSQRSISGSSKAIGNLARKGHTAESGRIIGQETFVENSVSECIDIAYRRLKPPPDVVLASINVSSLEEKAAVFVTFEVMSERTYIQTYIDNVILRPTMSTSSVPLSRKRYQRGNSLNLGQLRWSLVTSVASRFEDTVCIDNISVCIHEKVSRRKRQQFFFARSKLQQKANS